MRTKTTTVYPNVIGTNVANSVKLIEQDTTFLNAIGSQPSSSNIKRTGNSVDPNSLYTYLVDRLKTSKLNGYVPRDGSVYGIDGTPESYARFMTSLAGKESSFKTTTVGDVGRFVGNSNGLFQLSPNDALNYKLQSTPFTIRQLQDPFLNSDAAVRIMETLITRDGAITSYSNGRYGGAAAYWGPLRRGFKPTQSYVYAGSVPPTPGNFQPQIETAVNYWKAKKSPDPINSTASFFNDLNSNKLKNFNNDFIFYWYKKFVSQLPEVKSKVKIDEKSLLNEPSDSVGTLVNTKPRYTEPVSPVWDLNMSYSPPTNIPVQVQNKLTPATLELSYELNYSNTITQHTNQVNLQHSTDTTNIATDTTQSHGLNLMPPINDYQQDYDNQPKYAQCFPIGFGDDFFEYNNFFSNFNDQTGYNPRDTENNNLQKMPNLTYDTNVENSSQQVDLLGKKVKDSMNFRSMKTALACRRDPSSQGGISTDESNRQLLGTRRNINLRTPISRSESGRGVFASAKSIMAQPNLSITSFTNAFNNGNGINIPNFQNIPEFNFQLPQSQFIPSFVSSQITPNLNGFFPNVNGGLNSILQMPMLNMPNVLPSVNPGSFLELAAIMGNTDLKNLNADSILDTFEQIKNIVCDFKLPSFNGANFDNIANIDIGGNFQSLLQNLFPKIGKIDDFKNMLKSLVPDFKGLWDTFYAKLFECQNDKDLYS